MNQLWDILNSNLFVTILTIVFGGFISFYLTQKWQHRKIHFEKKHRAYVETFAAYHTLLKALKEAEQNTDDIWNDIHAKLLAANKINRVVFSNEQIFPLWKSVANNLGNARQHIADHSKERVINKLKSKIFNDAKAAEELMLEELQN